MLTKHLLQRLSRQVSRSFLFFILIPVVAAQPRVSFNGVIQTQWLLHADQQQSYLNRGTGVLRYDDQDKFRISQASVRLLADFNAAISLQAVLNSTEDPNHHVGLTQLFLNYSPLLSAKYRWRFRAGMFYPELGFENPDTGWLSPFHYSNSAISSWIGEELRTLGTEARLTLPGRMHGFAGHNLSISAALYKGNDTAGTLLAWRGWALHDRQSLINEQVPFARYPSIGPGGALARQAAWVEPYREIDGRFGYQFGTHWDYRKKTQVKYLYYNNNADDSILARGGQYAWHTLFHSLAFQHKLDHKWRIIAQAMTGKTSMGTGRVNVDFDAWYLSLIYRNDGHNVALRYDDFSTTDTDYLQDEDDNDGHGYAITATWRKDLNKQWQAGLEWIYVNSFQASRGQWPDRDTTITQQQLSAALQYRF